MNFTALGVAGSVGSLTFVPAGMPGAGHLKIISFASGGGNSDVLLVRYSAPVIPEPGTWVLVALGLGILSMACRDTGWRLLSWFPHRLRLRAVTCRPRTLASCSGSGSAV